MAASAAPPLLSGLQEVVGINTPALRTHGIPVGFGPPQFLELGANRFVIPFRDFRKGYFACLRFKQEVLIMHIVTERLR